MSFLLKGGKEDLLELATELRLEATVDMTKPMLKNLITRSAGYDEEDTKLMYEGIVEERKERELLEERERQDNLEFEKLRIEAQIGLNQEILSRNNRILNDLITGTNTVNEALELHKHAKLILKEENMNLRKWKTNSIELSQNWEAAKNRFTELLVKDAHKKVLHSGVADILIQVREKYWIPKGRQIIESIIRKCFICKKFNSRPGMQITAPLPRDRIEQSPPFAVTGLDFAGSIFVKNSTIECVVDKKMLIKRFNYRERLLNNF
ncbi:integrase catalytic domain-containing protein [Trichonephila clavata]|uniref:Integrase catalytic domain-containing protein n=1 Tax=Trichonephila clavata TaxID=2740835 RepID=A0A8X6H2H0_TRICU|nr:integrase catalytic domain-containing protein [Trichonephila clavata]